MKKLLIIASLTLIPITFLVVFLIPVIVVSSAVESTRNTTTSSQILKTKVTINSGTEFQNSFINKVGNAALSDNSGVFHSITVAQAILESDWGQSSLSAKYNNLFGIKGDYNGNSVNFPTAEFLDGVWVMINDNFRWYDSYEQSIKDHSDFLVKNPRYEKNGLFEAEDYIEQAYALQKSSYATDPTYAEKLIALIETFKLDTFDKYTNNLDGINEALSDDEYEKLMKIALEYEGMPYTFGGVAPRAFDCSSLTQWCYKNIGIDLPRTAQGQFNVSELIPIEDAIPGDMVFFTDTYLSGSFISHVGIYTGGMKMYNAGDPIGYADLNTSYWQEHIVCAGRVKKGGE